jgi:hypothetical protein
MRIAKADTVPPGVLDIFDVAGEAFQQGPNEE